MSSFFWQYQAISLDLFLEISLIEDAVFDAFEDLKGFQNRALLTDVDPLRTRFDLLQLAVLLVELLGLEVDDARRCTIREHLRLVDNRTHFVPVALVVLPEVWVVRDEISGLILTALLV